MGRDKAFVEVGHCRLFDYVFRKCSEIFSRVLVVTKSPEAYRDYHADIVRDELPVSASLVGLYTGLVHAASNHIFCVPCDMPFLNKELIHHLISYKNDVDVVIPKTRSGLEPLHAVYSKECVVSLKRHLDRQDYRINSFLSDVRVRYCDEEEIVRFDPGLTSFMNVNTVTELEEFARILGTRNVPGL
jgi:molybdopterin-guanine dinucleotide biosynthesis protein A